MLDFLHVRLVPYLANEERQLMDRVRDERMKPLLVADHDRLRAAVHNIESSSTRRLVGIAAAAVVDQLDRHVEREVSWVSDPMLDEGGDDAEG